METVAISELERLRARLRRTDRHVRQIEFACHAKPRIRLLVFVGIGWFGCAKYQQRYQQISRVPTIRDVRQRLAYSDLMININDLMYLRGLKRTSANGRVVQDAVCGDSASGRAIPQ